MGLSLFFGKTFGFSFVVLVTVIFLHALGFSSSIVFCARISSVGSSFLSCDFLLQQFSHTCISFQVSWFYYARISKLSFLL